MTADAGKRQTDHKEDLRVFALIFGAVSAVLLIAHAYDYAPKLTFVLLLFGNVVSYCDSNLRTNKTNDFLVSFLGVSDIYALTCFSKGVSSAAVEMGSRVYSATMGSS